MTEMDDLLIRCLSFHGVRKGAGAEIYLRLHGKPEMQKEFEEKLEKYNLQEAKIEPQNKSTVKKFEKQCLKTDTGIEITIPMDQYGNNDNVEFFTNPDGTISVMIKNIGKLTSN